MRVQILFVSAVLALVASAEAVLAQGPHQLEKLSNGELFERALAAKGDEYIKLRSELVERKNAVSFLKGKMSDKNSKTAIIAEAMLACINDPQRYLRYQQILKDAADAYFSSAAQVPHFHVGELEKELDNKNKGRLLAFFVQLAIKDSVAYLDYTKPAFAVEFLEKYFSLDFRTGEEELYYEFLASGCKHLKGIAGVAGLSHEQCQQLCELVGIMEKDVQARALFRVYATTSLHSFDNRVAQAALVELLRHDGNSQIRRYAIEGIKDPNAAVHLRAALQDSDPAVRGRAALALGKLGDVESVDALIATLEDKNPVVREGAAIALGQIGDPNAVEPLIQTLKELPETTIAVSLGNIDLEVLCGLLDDRGLDPNMPTATIVLALGDLRDVRAVPNLLLTLRDEDRLVRDFTAEALGKIGDRRAVGHLIDAVRRDDHPDVRSSGAKALGELGDPEAVEALIVAMGDESPHVRGNAAKALGRIGDSRALEALEKAAAHDKNHVVRRTANLAAKEIKKKKNKARSPATSPKNEDLQLSEAHTCSPKLN